MTVRAQGPLAPTGPPAPVMKSLDQIEPRTPVSSLPFVITQPGSYFLTGNLQFTAAAGDAITIEASDVTLDLNGFTLSSTAAVTGTGIKHGPGSGNTRIRNGTIAGTTTVIVDLDPGSQPAITPGGFAMGIDGGSGVVYADLTVRGTRQDGIRGFGVSRAEHLHLENNGGSGMDAGGIGAVITRAKALYNGTFGLRGFSVVTDCSATSNGMFGIEAETITHCEAFNNSRGMVGGTVTGCTARYNKGIGIDARTVTHSTARENRGTGIRVDDGGIIRGCNAFDNTGIGILATRGCAVLDNTSSGNLSHGIQANSENQIRGNTCNQNGRDAGTGAGIHTTGGDNRIEANACTENDRGLHMTNSGSLILRNTCASNTVVNYDIAASNRVGPIVSAPVSPAISGSTGGAGVGSENPWANFSF